MGIAPSDLAVNGATPVRTEPWPPSPHVEGERIVQLQVYSTITEKDCDDVPDALRKVQEAYRA